MGDNYDKAKQAYSTLTDPKGAFEDALFDNVFGDFLTFFNDILVGKQPGDDNDKCIAAILSTNSIETAQEAVIDIFNKSKEEIDQDVLMNQEITVNCGDAGLEDYQLEKEYDYNIFGQKIEPGCIKFGCCYDIEQLASSSISAINENITKEKNEMYNTISSTIKNDVNIEIGGQCNIGVLTEAIEKSRSNAVQKIERILNESTEVNVDATQRVEVKSKYPLRCMNECDEPPSAGKIKQNINIDIHSQNIVHSTYDTIIKNYKDMNIDSKVDIDAVPKGRLYLFSILALILILIIYYLLLIFGEGIILSFTGGKAPEIIKNVGEHGIAIVLFIILYIVYSTFICAYRTDMENLTCYVT